MTILCSAIGCKSKMGATQDGEKLSFHRFPKEEKLKNKWVVNMGRGDWRPSDSARLCSLHFEAECYRDGLQKRILHSYAIPTIFSTHRAKVKKNSRKPQLRLRPVPDAIKYLSSDKEDKDEHPIKPQIRLKPAHELLTSVNRQEYVWPIQPQSRIVPQELFITIGEDENVNSGKPHLCLKPSTDSLSSASEDEDELILIKCPEQHPDSYNDNEEKDMLRKGLTHYKMLADNRRRKLRSLQKQHLRVKKRLAYLEDILYVMSQRKET